MIFRALRALVYCDAFVVARYEYGVSSQPASSVPFSAAPSSLEVVVALGDLPEEEVAVRPDAGRRVRAQVLEPVGERVHDLGELAPSAPGAPSTGQPPPGRIDPVERVRDVLALHACAMLAAAIGLALLQERAKGAQ